MGQRLIQTLTVFFTLSFSVSYGQNQYYVVCPGSTVTLAGNSSNTIWFSDSLLTSVIGTGATFTSAPLFQSTQIYSAESCSMHQFKIDQFYSNSHHTIDHSQISGDDRGGIAVTDKYVYVVGDDFTARYDLDLNPGSGVQLPVRDGIFSDLSNGKLFTLWSTTSNIDPNNYPDSYNFDAIRTLNEDLSFGNEIISLSQPIEMGLQNAQNGIFSGMGILIVYSGNTNHYYAINLCDGLVEDLGMLTDPELYGTENWADWGVAERKNNQYSVVYRNFYNSNIIRRYLPGFNTENVAVFSDLSDMASITYSIKTKRWYFHNESTTPLFGGGAETVGYATANGNYQFVADPDNGITPFQVNVPVLNIGDHISFCSGEEMIIEAPGGFQEYNWNGTITTENTYNVNGNSTVILSVIDGYNCTLKDTLTVEVRNCTGITALNEQGEFNVWPNPASDNVNILPGISGAVRYDLIDASGRIIRTENWQDISFSSVQIVNVDGLSSGVYLIRLSGSSKVVTERLVIE